MPKAHTKFVCQQCGFENAKWMGRCPDCGEWNTLVETVLPASGASGAHGTRGAVLARGGHAEAIPLPQVQGLSHERLASGSPELDRVLGGGIVPGSIVLLGGEPGIGKCLVGSQRVLDPATGAWLPITAWAERKRSVVALDEARQRLTPQTVLAFHEQGVRPTVVVRTRQGRRLHCTPSHPLLTPQGWRSVRTLAVGSAIAAPSALPYFGTSAIPAQTLAQYTRALRHARHERDAAIPADLFCLPRQQMATFLATLLDVEGVGTATDFETASERLARDLQHLLLRFGLHAALTTRAGAAGAAYRLVIADDAGYRPLHALLAAADGVETSGDEQPTIVWDAVAAIEPAGEEPVFDLSVARAANFVANDLIVHNSTLLLQVAGDLALQSGDVLYVSAEESPQQIKLRAERLGIGTERLLLLAETELEAVVEIAERIKPAFMIVDSIQTIASPQIASAPGSISQVRECTLRLMRLAKSSGIPICIIGHVTKEGTVAGPRALEHIVDAVLYLEGERFHTYRLLRGVKNRFGATNEVGVFEMRGEGLVDVENPSALFLAEHSGRANGSAVIVSMEGTRPLLVEVQALVTTTAFGTPRCTTNGLDHNRMLMLLAVLTKRVGLALGNQDVYANVAGGFTLNEPAVDLGVAVAVASSFRERMVVPETVLIGEVGLAGELRAVARADARVREAAKLGFKRCIVPQSGPPLDRDSTSTSGGSIVLAHAATLSEALAFALE